MPVHKQCSADAFKAKIVTVSACSNHRFAVYTYCRVQIKKIVGVPYVIWRVWFTDRRVRHDSLRNGRITTDPLCRDFNFTSGGNIRTRVSNWHAIF